MGGVPYNYYVRMLSPAYVVCFARMGILQRSSKYVTSVTSYHLSLLHSIFATVSFAFLSSLKKKKSSKVRNF